MTILDIKSSLSSMKTILFNYIGRSSQTNLEVAPSDIVQMVVEAYAIFKYVGGESGISEDTVSHHEFYHSERSVQ